MDERSSKPQNSPYRSGDSSQLSISARARSSKARSSSYQSMTKAPTECPIDESGMSGSSDPRPVPRIASIAASRNPMRSLANAASDSRSSVRASSVMVPASSDAEYASSRPSAGPPNVAS